ncbi:hypothetical protein [Streptomyces sp. NPDC102462]|uniref:hypothetical protein n=1 Tax=Streptomyces sp. NPDC102462 TaxID=3366178 RepID=UPI00380B0243
MVGTDTVRGDRARHGYPLIEDAVTAVPRDNRRGNSRERPQDAGAARVTDRAAGGREV